MPARRLSNQCDSAGIHLIFRCIRSHEPNCRLHIVAISGKLELRRQPIVDAEPGKSSVTERLENVRDVLLLVARYPPATMHENCGGKWSRPVRNVGIQCEPNGTGVSKLDIPKFS